jgi:cold shock CspA family protein
MKGPSIMAEISIWSAAIIVMLVMFAASIGFVAAAILAGARSDSDIDKSNQIQGTFARWSRDKRFGFIDGDDHQEHFVHTSEFKKIRIRPPQPGDRLAFTLKNRAKGSRAVGLSYVTTPSDVDRDEAALIFSNRTDYQRRSGAQRKAVDRVS